MNTYMIRRVVYFKDLELALNSPPPGYELFQVLPYADTEMFVTIWQVTAAGRYVQDAVIESKAAKLLQEIEANPLGSKKKGANK